MRRLFGWVLAPAMLMAAGSASAGSLDIRNAALRVVIIPEARSDVSITVLKTNPRLPIWVSKDLTGAMVSGRVGWFAPFGRPIWCGAGGDVYIWGVGRIANADLPQIVVRMPLDARVSADGGVFGAISASNRLDLDVSGCGDWVVGNVHDHLGVSNSGSAAVRTGAAGQMTVQVSGSGRIVTRAVANGLDAALSGSAAIIVEQASGPVSIRGSGSGELVVNGGRATSVDVQLSGSGDVRFMGVAEDLHADLSGNGRISAGAVTRSLGVDITGSGDISVEQASGTVRADVSGSGALRIDGGHASSVEAHLSGSGDVDFAGVADTLNASASGAGNLRVARVTGAVVSSTSGSGRVSVNR
jgi:hypothetical protein